MVNVFPKLPHLIHPIYLGRLSVYYGIRVSFEFNHHCPKIYRKYLTFIHRHLTLYCLHTKHCTKIMIFKKEKEKMKHLMQTEF